MLWMCLSELDLLMGIIMIIIYGLYSLHSENIDLLDINMFGRSWLLLVLLSYVNDGVDCQAASVMQMLTEYLSVVSSAPVKSNSVIGVMGVFGLDVLLCLLTFIIMLGFESFESILLMMFAFTGQLGLMHCCDLLGVFVCLEMQNFSFVVLCGLHSNKPVLGMLAKGSSLFSVEAAIKYMLLSAFSTGVMLYGISSLYLQTGMSSIQIKEWVVDLSCDYDCYLILLSLMFKLGAAPFHFWSIDLYTGVKRPLLMYISTTPKLSLFGFWISSWHEVCTEYSVCIFVIYSMLLGVVGAYAKPALRQLFAYSTINEIGLLLMAIETAGFNALMQHLMIYMVSQLLLWQMVDERLFSVLAVSLAGMPPMAGFCGKLFIFMNAVNVEAFFLLSVSLMCTGLSLVYYIRVIRLYWCKPTNQTLRFLRVATGNLGISTVTGLSMSVHPNVHGKSVITLTSSYVIFLCFGLLFFIKPFVL